MKKFTIADVQNYLDEHDTNHDCTLLSTEYENSKTPLRFLCNKCNEEFSRTFTSVKRNEKFTCARCSQGRNLDIEQVRDFLDKNDINHDCTLLSTHYSNYHTPLEFQCNCCGEKFTRKMSQVKEGNFKCFKCLKKQQGGKNRFNIEYVKNYISENDINNDCELLSTEYIDNNSPLLFKCNTCGKTFERTFSTMKRKRAFKCFKCAHHIDPNKDPKTYDALKSYFRGKTYLWKKDFLATHTKCDILNTNEDIELDIHHLNSFSSILNQASLNTGIPLIYKPNEFEKYGYSLEILTNEFLKLHDKTPAVLLEKNIHQLFHKEYGYKNNAPEQYYEFKEKYLKGEI